jgi:hypothetical protein
MITFFPSKDKKIKREIEKEKLLKRLAEIDKEEIDEQDELQEEHEQQEENEQQEEPEFLFDDEIDINTKTKRKRDTQALKFDDVIESIEMSEDDKKFLETKQQQYAKEFLEKFTDNDFLYVHKNIYEPEGKDKTFILLNIPEDDQSFREYISIKYKAANVNLSGVWNRTNYKVYYTNTLQDVEKIVENIKFVFLNSGYGTVKMQLRFGVIWEGPTVEDEGTQIISDYGGDSNISILKSMSLSSSSSSMPLAKMERRRRYYAQDVYQTNFQKYPLVLVNHNNYVRTIEAFIKTHLKELQVKNREDGESNHRIVAVYNLQCYLYNVGKPIGGKQGRRV